MVKKSNNPKPAPKAKRVRKTVPKAKTKAAGKAVPAAVAGKPIGCRTKEQAIIRETSKFFDGERSSGDDCGDGEDDAV